MKALFGVLGALALFAGVAAAGPSGGGGSAVYPVMARWAQNYQLKTGVAINYQPIGSGGGIRQSLSRTIDFGNTDMALSAAELQRGKLVQHPILFIAIVPVVTLPGVSAGALVLDGPTLGDIYLGKIKRWDDAAIARLNPQAKLPGLPIIVVHRSDASGTTWHFTSYLAAANRGWRASVGAGAAVAWPVGSAAKGNAGVVATLKQTRGAIGYVEYAYALQNRLVFTGLVNRDGARVLPGMASFRAAAGGADFSRQGGPIAADPPGRESWPLTAASYMLLHADDPAERNREIVRFLDYALHDGRGEAERLGYVPLPDPAVKTVEGVWAALLGLRP